MPRKKQNKKSKAVSDDKNQTSQEVNLNNIENVYDNASQSESKNSSKEISPQIRLAWPTILYDAINNYSVSIPQDIKKLKDNFNSSNNDDFLKDFNSLHFQISMQLDTLKNLADYMFQEFNKLAQIVNNVSSSDQNTNVNTDYVKLPILNDNSSQTESCENKNLFHKAIQVNLEDKNTNSQPLCFNQNSVIYTENSVDKMVRLIIFKCPENTCFDDISNFIHQLPFDNIKVIFIDKKVLIHERMCNFIIETNKNVAKYLLQNKYIEIKSKYYSVKRFIFINRCFVCQDFNHQASSCENIRVCPFCSLSHCTEKCNNPFKCINCIKNNMYNNMNFNVKHPAFSSKCPSLKLYINKARQRFEDM